MARGRYRYGRLVWVRLRSRSGKKELHPAIIISADEEIVQPERFDPRADFGKVNALAVVGVSSEYKRYPPSVGLPFANRPGGHIATKLVQDCGACIGWYDWVVLEEDVEGLGGDVPESEMRRIMELIAKDLETKLARKIATLRKDVESVESLLSKLMGRP